MFNLTVYNKFEQNIEKSERIVTMVKTHNSHNLLGETVGVLFFSGRAALKMFFRLTTSEKTRTFWLTLLLILERYRIILLCLIFDKDFWSVCFDKIICLHSLHVIILIIINSYG